MASQKPAAKLCWLTMHSDRRSFLEQFLTPTRYQKRETCQALRNASCQIWDPFDHRNLKTWTEVVEQAVVGSISRPQMPRPLADARFTRRYQYLGIEIYRHSLRTARGALAFQSTVWEIFARYARLLKPRHLNIHTRCWTLLVGDWDMTIQG